MFHSHSISRGPALLPSKLLYRRVSAVSERSVPSSQSNPAVATHSHPAVVLIEIALAFGPSSYTRINVWNALNQIISDMFFSSHDVVHYPCLIILCNFQASNFSSHDRHAFERSATLVDKATEAATCTVACDSCRCNRCPFWANGVPWLRSSEKKCIQRAMKTWQWGIAHT